MTNLTDESQFLMDFNVQDVAVSAGLEIPDTASAAILDVSKEDLLAYHNQVERTLAQVAAQLLQSEASISTMVRELRGLQRVLAIGDSITTYRYSYARLIKHLLPDVDVINHGYSGYTSNHGLELTHTRFINLQPDLVFIKYGVNDCKRFAGAEGRTLVSAEEYRGNLRGIIRAFRQFTDAEIVLITPTPVVTAITNTNADFQALHMTWQNSDIKGLAAILRELSHEYQTRLVDLYALLGDEPDAALYLADGLHPNFAGQQVMLKAIAGVFS